MNIVNPAVGQARTCSTKTRVDKTGEGSFTLSKVIAP